MRCMMEVTGEKVAQNTMITHTMLVVSNLERSLDFYTGVLGLKMVKKRSATDARERGASSALAFVADGAGHGIELKQPFQEPVETGAGKSHICLLCDDFGGMLEKLRESGSEPYNVREQLGMHMVLVNDPDGHVVELIERESYMRWWEDPEAGL